MTSRPNAQDADLRLALEEAQAAATREREAARAADGCRSRHGTDDRRSEHDAQAVIEARVAERQAQLAVVERLLGAVRAIDSARSLSDTLTA